MISSQSITTLIAIRAACAAPAKLSRNPISTPAACSAHSGSSLFRNRLRRRAVSSDRCPCAGVSRRMLPRMDAPIPPTSCRLITAARNLSDCGAKLRVIRNVSESSGILR